MITDFSFMLMGIGALVMFAAWISYLVWKETKPDVDEFDGGFDYMNKPRVKTKVVINNREEEYK